MASSLAKISNIDFFIPPPKVLATSNNSENSSIKRALLVHYSADSTAEPAELSAAFLNGVRGVTYDSADFTPEMSRLTDEELMSSSSLPAMKWALMQAGIPPTEHGVTDEKHIPIFFDVCGDMERRVVVQYLLLYHCRAVQRARLKLAFGIVRRKLMFNIAPNIAKALREAERFEARYRTYRVLQDVRARPLVLCTVSWMARLMEVQQRSETRLNETVLRWRFGCAVIDEAGTCPRSFLPVLLSMGIRKLVFVGDPDQLPPYLDALPVVGSRIDRHTEQGRIQDLHGNGGRGDQAVTNGSTAKDHPAVTKRTNGDEDHQAVFIPGQVGATDPPRDSATPAGDQYPTVMLCQNYRMPTTIQKLVGRLFYDDRLRSFDGQTAGKFTWFDVGAAQNAFESSAGSSRINLVEAAFLLLRLQSFAAPQKSVLVLSFYRAQKLLIYTLVEQFFPDWLHSKKIRVCTIDEAQGSEQKRVFLTTVRCENERGQLVGGGATAGSARKAFGGGGGSLGFVTDRRRLNVGLSRSSQELTIVGSVGTLADRDFKWAAVRDAGTVKVPSDDLVGSAVAKFMPQVKQTARRLFGAGADQRVVDNSGGRRARGGRGWRGGGEKDAIGRNVGGLEAFRKGSNGGGKGGGAPFAPAARPRQPAWGAGPGAEAGKKAAEKFSPAKQEKTGGKNGGKGHGQGGKDSSRSEKGNKRGKGRGRSGTPSSPGTSPRVGSSPSSNKGSSSWGKRKDGCIGSK